MCEAQENAFNCIRDAESDGSVRESSERSLCIVKFAGESRDVEREKSTANEFQEITF